MAVKAIRPSALASPLGLYSHGMAAGGLVVVAGQVGVGPTGEPVGSDVEAQTTQALANVAAVLAEAGCTMRDVIRFQTFLVDADDIPAFMRARHEAFRDHFPDAVHPPNTLLVVSRLVRPELRVEIEALAVQSGAAARRQTRAAAPRGRRAPTGNPRAARRRTRRP